MSALGALEFGPHFAPESLSLTWIGVRRPCLGHASGFVFCILSQVLYSESGTVGGEDNHS